MASVRQRGRCNGAKILGASSREEMDNISQAGCVHRAHSPARSTSEIAMDARISDSALVSRVVELLALRWRARRELVRRCRVKRETLWSHFHVLLRVWCCYWHAACDGFGRDSGNSRSCLFEIIVVRFSCSRLRVVESAA
jgi:hypothetical protein